MVNRMDHMEAKSLLPLLRAIAKEVRERRSEVQRIEALRTDLDYASLTTPEGFASTLQDLDNELRIHQRGLDEALRELYGLGLEVPSIEPLTVHIPGTSNGSEVVFYWQESVENATVV